MKWTRFRIRTTTEAEDIIISSLYDIGLEGAQIEDKLPLSPLEKEQMFVDIPPEMEEDNGIACLSFFVEQTEEGSLLLLGEKVSAEEIKKRIEKELEELRFFMNIGSGEILIDETEDLDWINNWKQFFHQFYVDDLLVIPSWEEVKEKDKNRKILHIDPGTAFGTGMHETTQLCIRQIWKHLTAETKLLDIGTGSGILGIVSLMYGADSVVGTDIDSCALSAVEENLQANGVDSDRFRFFLGNLITDEKLQKEVGEGCYDIVAANILADILIPLAPVAFRHLKRGGVFITSGIIAEKKKQVKDAFEREGFVIKEITKQGEWVNITAGREV